MKDAKKLSQSQKYSVDELAKELNFSTKLKNGIRKNFGDPISISELKQINQSTFLACKYLGWKSWYEFKTSLSIFYASDHAVVLINKPNMDNVIVEIDTTRPFREVIQDLADILQNKR